MNKDKVIFVNGNGVVTSRIAELEANDMNITTDCMSILPNEIISFKIQNKIEAIKTFSFLECNNRAERRAMGGSKKKKHLIKGVR